MQNAPPKGRTIREGPARSKKEPSMLKPGKRKKAMYILREHPDIVGDRGEHELCKVIYQRKKTTNVAGSGGT